MDTLSTCHLDFLLQVAILLNLVKQLLSGYKILTRRSFQEPLGPFVSVRLNCSPVLCDHDGSCHIQSEYSRGILSCGDNGVGYSPLSMATVKHTQGSNPLETATVFSTSVYLTSFCNSATLLIRPFYLSHLGGRFRGVLLYIVIPATKTGIVPLSLSDTVFSEHRDIL